MPVGSGSRHYVERRSYIFDIKHEGIFKPTSKHVMLVRRVDVRRRGGLDSRLKGKEWGRRFALVHDGECEVEIRQVAGPGGGEALRLGRMLVHLIPRVAEVHGLLALMEIQASRFAARQDANGPVLLEDQNRMLSDRLLIRRGLDSLERAAELGGGPYPVQAAIAACHARASGPEDTDWAEIARLYDGYVEQYPSPIAELSRGIAHWRAYGTDAAREVLEPLRADPRMPRYHLLYGALAEIETADGHLDEATAHLRAALALTESAADSAILEAKLSALLSDGLSPPEPYEADA